LGRWKTPRYQATRETNDEDDIIKKTRSAYLAQNDLEKLNILRRLKGVGIAVASTILYYLQPDKFAIYDYHVRNSLRDAGRLSNVAEGDSNKAWLEYTRIIRELSTFYNKTLREVEKALFAYDKWGCGENEADGEEREMGKTLVRGTIVKPGDYSGGVERQEIEIWEKCFKTLPYKNYPVDVTLVIKQREYQAMLRFSKSHKTAWMPAHLNNKKARLVDALKRGGFVRGRVELKIMGKRIWILKQLTVAQISKHRP